MITAPLRRGRRSGVLRLPLICAGRTACAVATGARVAAGTRGRGAAVARRGIDPPSAIVAATAIASAAERRINDMEIS
jgi:hypothetical protein